MATEAPAAAAPPAAAAAAPDGAGKKRKLPPNPNIRKKLKKEVDPKSLDPEERKRRAEQKRRREIALKVRAQGQSYNPQKLRKAQGGGGGKTAGGGGGGGGGYGAGGGGGGGGGGSGGGGGYSGGGGAANKVKRADRVKLKAGQAHRCSHHVRRGPFLAGSRPHPCFSALLLLMPLSSVGCWGRPPPSPSHTQMTHTSTHYPSTHTAPTPSHPTPTPQVIVLPIYWNQRFKEKQEVMGAAEEAVKVLRGVGLDVALDEGDKYTPGQKVGVVEGFEGMAE
jgi:hypothetical protein